MSNLPPKNRNFTGRKQLLDDLEARLAGEPTETGVHAETLHGLGGVGKTQLVLEYAHRHTADYARRYDELVQRIRDAEGLRAERDRTRARLAEPRRAADDTATP